MRYALVLIMTLGLAAGAWAQGYVAIDDDFEGGVTDFVNWIRADYDDVPTVVTSDADFPAAWPQPWGGTHVLRNADDDNTVWGLSGAHASGEATVANYVHRANVAFVAATMEAQIYLATSASATEHNFALCAIEDADAPNGPTPGGEAYYRFGYKSATVYLDLFDSAGRYGAGGTTNLGNDAAILSSMTIPGWNKFTLVLDSANVNCFVNDVACSFNPVALTAMLQMTIGGLAFNMTSQDPLLMDNVYFAMDPATVPVELSVFTAH